MNYNIVRALQGEWLKYHYGRRGAMAVNVAVRVQRVINVAEGVTERTDPVGPGARAIASARARARRII